MLEGREISPGLEEDAVLKALNELLTESTRFWKEANLDYADCDAAKQAAVAQQIEELVTLYQQLGEQFRKWLEGQE